MIFINLFFHNSLAKTIIIGVNSPLFPVFLIFFEKKEGNACTVKKEVLLLHRQKGTTNSSVAQSVRAPDC